MSVVRADWRRRPAAETQPLGGLPLPVSEGDIFATAEEIVGACVLKMRVPGFAPQVQPLLESEHTWIRKLAKRYLSRYPLAA